MFVRESDLPEIKAHGGAFPTRKRVFVGKGIIPQITQIATSVSYDECDTSSDLHVHKTMWEIYFVRSGRAMFRIGGEKNETGQQVGAEVYEVEPGDFIAVPPNTFHTYKVAPGETIEFFYFGVAID